MTLRWIILLAALPALGQQKSTRILIAYHSETGQTEAFAKEVRDGAASVAGVEVLLRKMDEVKAEEIALARGILAGSPVHWQNVTSATRRFLDRLAETLGKQGKAWGEGRTAGVFCTAGAPASGKDVTRLSAISAFLALRFVIIGGVDEEGYGTLGAQATTGAVDPGLSDKEKAEARRFGERFARLTVQFRK